MTKGRIKNHVPDLKKERENREKREISWLEISKDTGLSYAAVSRWKRQQVERFDSEALMAFCRYFGVEPGDILSYDRDAQVV